MSIDEKNMNDLNSGCGASEPYALQVTDNSMEPEFPEGCIVLIDPSGNLSENNYVFIEYDGVRWFRKLTEVNGEKRLIALNEMYPEILLDSSYDILGIIVQKNVKGEIKHYK